MYHILQTLTRLLAPVLSFLAEEVWSYLMVSEMKRRFLLLLNYRIIFNSE